MNTKDIREMSEAEIEKKLRDTRDAQVNLRLRKQTGQVEHPTNSPKCVAKSHASKLSSVRKTRRSEA